MIAMEIYLRRHMTGVADSRTHSSNAYNLSEVVGIILADCFVGAGNRNRTRDLLITNQLLYQLSYAGFYAIIAVASRTSGYLMT